MMLGNIHQLIFGMFNESRRPGIPVDQCMKDLEYKVKDMFKKEKFSSEHMKGLKELSEVTLSLVEDWFNEYQKEING